MTTYYLCPISAILQYFNDTGIVLSGGKINTYLAGTSTPQATYTDSTGGTTNANPIILNSAGRLPNVTIWQPGGINLKLVFTDSSGNPIGQTFDQVSGINDPAGVNSELSNAASGSGADLVANAMRSYDIFSSMRAANVPVLGSGQTLIVGVRGGSTLNDNLGGLFLWDSASTATDDGVNVIKPTAESGAGRYLRLTATIYAAKPSPTSRASTTTATADPDLQIPILNPGTYAFEAFITDEGGTSAGGLKGTFAYSGTLDHSFWAAKGIGLAAADVVGLTVNVVAQVMQTAQNGQEVSIVTGGIIVTGAGTLSFNWAQNSSNTTASIVGGSSWMRVTRMK